jgi:hypothetical protein
MHFIQVLLACYALFMFARELQRENSQSTLGRTRRLRLPDKREGPQ